jgi:hypothetical protein
MTLLWQVSLALEAALFVVFALVVATTLLTSRHGGATVTAYPRRPAHDRRHRIHRAA